MQEPKVLIVDDEEEARLYIANILEELFPNFHVLLATSASEASFLLIKESVQVILLDVELPEKSGLEFLQSLRNEEKMTPVIIISAYKRAEFVQQALRMNAVDYIDKPVNPIELDNALRKALNINTPNDLLQFYINDSADQFQNKIRLNTAKGMMFFNINDILMFTSHKRDSFLVSIDNSKLLIKNNLVNLMKILPNKTFLHVNRQTIININFLKGVSKSQKSITLKNISSPIYPVTKEVLNFLTNKNTNEQFPSNNHNKNKE